jgi:hypothetical protein
VHLLRYTKEEEKKKKYRSPHIDPFIRLCFAWFPF